MGVRGAAIATVMGQVATFIMSAIYLFHFKTFRFDASAFRLKIKTCGKVLSPGISSFITQIAITIVMALSNNLLVAYGAQSIYGSEIPLTAMGIVMKVNQILISILVGISTGAQPIIGYNYGSKNFLRVRKAFDIAVDMVAVEVIQQIPCDRTKQDGRHGHCGQHDTDFRAGDADFLTIDGDNGDGCIKRCQNQQVCDKEKDKFSVPDFFCFFHVHKAPLWVSIKKIVATATILE